MAGGQRKKPGAGLLLKRQSHIFEPHFPPGACGRARKAFGGFKVEEKRQIRFHPDHQIVQPVNRDGQIASRDALKDAG